MNKIILWIVGALLLGNFFGWNLHKMADDRPRPTMIIRDTVLPVLDTFSEANLVKFMEILDIQHPDIVLNQAKHETGNFTSNRFKKYNALFGFQSSDTNIHKYN